MNEFESRVSAVDTAALFATRVELLQLNLGLRCDLACVHCHQSSSPRRTEEMSDAIIEAALQTARHLRPALVDLTGGAPELHPGIRDMVVSLRGMGLEVQVRTNLTVLLEPLCEDLPDHGHTLGQVECFSAVPLNPRARGYLLLELAAIHELAAVEGGLKPGRNRADPVSFR